MPRRLEGWLLQPLKLEKQKDEVDHICCFKNGKQIIATLVTEKNGSLHSPENCYSSTGWTLERKSRHKVPMNHAVLELRQDGTSLKCYYYYNLGRKHFDNYWQYTFARLYTFFSGSAQKGYLLTLTSSDEPKDEFVKELLSELPAAIKLAA